MTGITFPRVEIERENREKVPVYIYGFAHGVGIKGSSLTREVAEALKREAATFEQHDYVAMEGTDENLTRYALRSSGVKTGFKVSRSFMREALAQHIPQVVRKAEHIEDFDLIRKLASDLDGSITRQDQFLKRSTIQESQGDQEGQTALEKAKRTTQITSLEMETFKREMIKELVAKGIEKKKAELYVESQHTFRSLLMARAVRHRAMATGLPVRLFVGFAHTHEIVDFLDEDKVNAYVKTLPRPLKDLYDRYEQHGWGVVDIFEKHRHNFEQRHHPRFFKWLAQEAVKPYYDRALQRRAVINIARFREQLRVEERRKK